MTLEEFMKDETLKQASIKSLEIIEEASKNIHDDFKRKLVS
ncbi:MAG: hypothetical protein ACC656_12225 [Candidatus Heimdallarchaeota archaeon]